MTRAFYASWPAAGRKIEYNGESWTLSRPVVTSDGFLTAWGVPDPRPGDEGVEEGYDSCGHSFFLGRLES